MNWLLKICGIYSRICRRTRDQLVNVKHHKEMVLIDVTRETAEQSRAEPSRGGRVSYQSSGPHSGVLVNKKRRWIDDDMGPSIREVSRVRAGVQRACTIL